MTHPVASFWGNAVATIWSVDDAWFEGSRDIQPSLDALISLDTENEANRNIGNKNQYYHSFQELEEKITTVSFAKLTAQSGDFSYFVILAKLCLKNNLRLVLCNFEYLELEFDNINKVKNAILLDINYTLEPQGNSNGYGIELLRKLIQGKRPRADIFFVTSYEAEMLSYLGDPQSNNDSSYWLFKWLPRIVKSSNLEQELKQFVNYFTQGINKSWKDLIQELWEALIKINLEGISHPSNQSDFNKIPKDFLLRECFTTWNDDAGESFKALYDYWEDSYNAKGNRTILIDIFQEHLAYVNIKLNLTKKTPENINHLKLPVQPGILFLINLSYFLYRLNENEDYSIDLEIDHTGPKGKATLIIPLEPHKNSEALKEAVITGNRKTIEAFRSLIACKELLTLITDTGQTIDLIPGEFKEDGEKYAQQWRLKKLVPGHERIYRQLIDYEFANNSLRLKWEYEKSSTKPPLT